MGPIQPVQAPSKVRIALMWAFLIGNIAFWIGFFLWRGSLQAPRESASFDLVRVVFMLLMGGLFLGAGVVGYVVVLFTHCLSFDFNHPVWPGVKGKLFIANILVPLTGGLGLGFMLSSVLTPLLLASGLNSEIAGLLPVLAMVGVVQVAQLWVMVWAPLERRLIARRLQVLGITPEQLKSAFLVGLSNPASGMLKRFGSIEEDIGALWITQDQLVYWGDGERFGISREQLTAIDRQADNRSVSLLAGITHVMLLVKTPTGVDRQIRLHTEGQWTLGQKRQMMDRLSQAILQWHRPSPALA